MNTQLEHFHKGKDIHRLYGCVYPFWLQGEDQPMMLGFLVNPFSWTAAANRHF